MTLTKHPGDNRIYDMDFARYAELGAGQTLTALTSVDDTKIKGSGSLTITPSGVLGSRAQFRISGGSAGDEYRIEATVTTSGSSTLVGCGNLQIKIC